MASMTEKVCTVCKQANKVTAFRCKGCGASLADVSITSVQDAEASPPAEGKSDAHLDLWECTSCGFARNEPSDATCKLCDRERNSRADHSNLAGTYREDPLTFRLVLPCGDFKFANEIKIGRDPGYCVFADQLQGYLGVSREHAHISWDGIKLFVVDTSMNGTFINERRIEKMVPTEIKPGDRIRFASSLSGSIEG